MVNRSNYFCGAAPGADGSGWALFQCSAALCFFLRRAGLLEDVSCEAMHLKIVRGGLNTTLVVDAGIRLNVVPVVRV